MVIPKGWIECIAAKRDDLEATLERERQNFETILERAQARANSGQSKPIYKILESAEDIYWRDWSRGTLTNRLINAFYGFLEGKTRPCRNNLSEERIKKIKYLALRNQFIDKVKTHYIETNPEGLLEAIRNFEDVALKELGFRRNWEAFEASIGYNPKSLQDDCYRARQNYLWEQADKMTEQGVTDIKTWEDLYYSLEKLSLLLEGSKEHIRNLRLKVWNAHEQAYHKFIDRIITRTQYKLAKGNKDSNLLTLAENANTSLITQLDKPIYRSEEITQLKEQAIKLAS